MHHALDAYRTKTGRADLSVIAEMPPHSLASFVVECAKVLAWGQGVVRVYKSGRVVAEFDKADADAAIRAALDLMRG